MSRTRRLLRLGGADHFWSHRKSPYDGADIMGIIPTTSRVSPFLWFDHEAEAAAALYVSLIPNSAIQSVTRFGDPAQGQTPSVVVVEFTLDGVAFKAMNGGPGHPFADAISIYVDCNNQSEVDDLYGRLTDNGGAAGPCGWLKDKFGLSWQIVPSQLPTLLSDPDAGRAQRAMQAMLGMTKIDIAAVQRAADNRV
jgi:predicted 3-demethylubiquinone-9 3-methyltransferase (glyoxalase superfamily)